MIQVLSRLPSHARVVAISAVAIILLLVGVILARLGGWFWQQHLALVDMEPRVARLLGYRDSEDQLRQASEAARAELDGQVFSGESATVGAAIQQQVRRVLEASGFEVLGSQVVDSVVHESLEEVRVNMTTTGSMEALDLALSELASARPLLLVDALEITSANVRANDVRQVVNVTLTIKGVRVR